MSPVWKLRTLLLKNLLKVGAVSISTIIHHHSLVCQYDTDNSLIRINGKPFFYKSWSAAGVSIVSNLFDETSSSFFTFVAFKEKYLVKVNFLHYYSGVERETNLCFSSNVKYWITTEVKGLLKISLHYTYRATCNHACMERSQSKWISDLLTYSADKIDWSKSYSLPFLCARESKLRIFQFKLLHRSNSTNRYLFKIGLSSSELCSFCTNSSETLLHLFWECPQVKIECIKFMSSS